MYIPKPFIQEDINKIYEFIDNNSFGTIISNQNGLPVATHLPLLLDRDNHLLSGHFAKTNTQWKDIINQEILVIFQGLHSYISSSWYETNVSVPTWNYLAVHVYGKITFIDDSKELLQDLNGMINKYEEPLSQYSIDDSNREFIDGLMKGIIGFRIKINKIEGKWKLSQNHSKERQELVISKLKQINSENTREIAGLMEENLK